jgi:Low molecular weight phosphotyrosine protein phosphatase
MDGCPLFVCHANCCRSVLACYLYRHLCHKALALSAGLDMGQRINDRAERMFRAWGIDASAHSPLKLSRVLCAASNAIFDGSVVLAPHGVGIRRRPCGQVIPVCRSVQPTVAEEGRPSCHAGGRQHAGVLNDRTADGVP